MKFAIADPLLQKLNDTDREVTLRLKEGHTTKGFVEDYDEVARTTRSVCIVHPHEGAETCDREHIGIKEIISISHWEHDHMAIAGRR